MSVICPQCSFENPDQPAYCARCGTRLQTADDTIVGARPQVNAVPAGGPPPAQPPSQPLAYQQPPQQPSQPQPTPPPPGYQQPQPGAYPQAGYPSYPPQGAPAPGMAYAPQPAPRGGQGLDALQHAFAGSGTPVSYHTWRIQEKQPQIPALYAALIDALRQQGFAATQERLREYSSQIPERDYVAVRLGPATVFTYAAPVGRDLHISRTTTILPKVSPLRLITLIILILVMLVSFVLFNVLQPESAFVGGLTSFLAFLSFTLLFLLIAFLIRCVALLLTDKDFLAPLRIGRLNDFQADEITSLETSTDNALRSALKQLGVDTQAITPPAEQIQPRQRIRLI